jgi:hypothetical protein
MQARLAAGGYADPDAPGLAPEEPAQPAPDPKKKPEEG